LAVKPNIGKMLSAEGGASQAKEAGRQQEEADLGLLQPLRERRQIRNSKSEI
jgi:hypothetical protein